jgi:hypothetical protein
MVRVVVLPTSGMRVPGAVPEALVQPDGSFEFLKMPPGKYTLRLLPASPVVTVPIDVQDQDVGPLALSLGVAVSGRVLIEGGGELPPRKDAPLGMANVPPLLGLQARRTDSGAGPAVQLRPDGTFLWMAPVGEYRLGVTMLPFGYSVKSMEYGTANLVEVPLKITDPLENPSATIRITLTTTPLPNESAGVKVSGQVLGIPGGASSGEFWVRLQTSVAPASITQGVLQRVGEAQLRIDGTFELIRVPPGVYNAQVFPRSGPPISGGMAIVVESADVTGAQLVANPAPISSIISSPSPLPLTSPGAGTLPSTEPRGVGVRGNIQLSFAGAYPDTVVLFGSRPGGLTFEVPVRKDGSFEFKNVPPGMYDARTLPLAAPPKSTTLLIEGRDLTGVQISIPPLTEVRGQIDLEGGGRVADVSTLGIKLISTDGSIEIPVSRDGRFAMKINQGEYRVSVTRLPTNSVVRKMTHGTTDLSKASYNTNTSGEIRITIGAAP